jgi:hypothetical protein
MSKPREENPELARVLSRVNALMKHDLEPTGEIVSEDNPPDQHIQALQEYPDDEVPVLTEVYEGELAPVPPDASAAGAMAASAMPLEPDDAALDAIVAELMPLIRAEVKKAVRQELVNMEKIVIHQLESEFLQTLMQRLRSDAAD